MTISLVSAPIVGFDLVRHPRGRSVADILLWGLSLRPGELAAFNTVSAGSADARGAAWSEVRTVQDALGRGVLNGSVLAAAAGPVVEGSLTSMIESLRGSLIMDLDDLEHLIRNDILDPGQLPGATEPVDPTAAADVLLDAVVAEWVDGLSVHSAAELGRTYRAMGARLGVRETDVGPCADEVYAVVDRLRNIGPDGCARLRTVNDLLGSGGSRWAEAVHEASWAALTTGRIRAAATAQLLTVKAFLDGGLGAADGAEGVWNLISGHVHACVVADVLPAETQQLLARGWQSALSIG
jgi:hypothetical protein